MKKKKDEKNKKRQLIITIATIIIPILLISISLLVPTSGSNKNIFKELSMSIERIVVFPITTKDDSKNQTESYIIQKNVNASLEKEIKDLKEALELNKTLTEYEPINATILSRNKSYWFNTITIDKGSTSGIKKNMAVITKNGLIGKISKVHRHSSEIKLITTDDINFKVSVAIKTNGIDNYAIMSGYNQKKNLIKATGIDKTTPVNIGDIVLTSGLGEMFPAGIYVGTIEEVIHDKYNISKTVYIKTNQDFNDIHYVTVLKVEE